jgi:predicted dehydrogenase
MANPVRIGVVGFGYWGPNLVRNLDKLVDAQIVVACDLSQVNLDKLAALYPYVETTTDLDELLSEKYALDAVVVATSAPSHFAIARRVIEAGKHCYVEKPLTLKSADSEALVRLADEKGVVLFVGHLMEYHSASNWIKEYIASGDLGDVLYVYMQRLNLGKVRTEENAFWSLAPHDVSIVLYVLGEAPDSVSANGAAYVTPGVQDTVFANLHFPSGKMANIHVSWLDPHNEDARVRRHGSDREDLDLRPRCRRAGECARVRRRPLPALRRHHRAVGADEGTARHRGPALPRLLCRRLDASERRS